MNRAISTEQAIRKIMETPEGCETAFLCYYELQVHSAYERFSNSEEWMAVEQLLKHHQPPTETALDLGAGNGIASYALWKSGYSVTMLEPDASELVGYGALLNYQKSNMLPINPVSGYGETLPFKNHTFGLVYVRQALHHAVDLIKMMSEIHRVLVPNGLLIATREHIVDDNESLKSFLENHALHKYTNSEGAYKREEYVQAIEVNGFKLEKLLLSWDSVINHYPTSNNNVREGLRKALRAKLGVLGTLLSNLTTLEDIYRHRKSINDHRPGRMISFIARAK